MTFFGDHDIDIARLALRSPSGMLRRPLSGL